MATEYKLSYTAQEIDKKLKEVVPPDFAQNDPIALDYIKNRTHWAEAPVTTTTVILPESTIELEEGYWEGVTSLTLTENAECTVTWDGIEYTSVSKKVEADGMTGIVLGNTVWMDGEDNGQPFMIAYVVDYSVISVQSMDGATASHTVGITQTATTQEIHKLDNKYIDAEWIAKPPIGFEQLVHFPENTLTFSEYIGSTYSTELSIDCSDVSQGDTFKLIIDGTEYIETVKSFFESLLYIGNISGYFNGDMSIGSPYCVAFDASMVFIILPTSGDHTISLTIERTVYEKIPMHYLPDDIGGLPEVVPDDEGAFLRVVNGEWKAVVLPSVEEGEF